MTGEAVDPTAHVGNEVGGRPTGQLDMFTDRSGITGVEVLCESIHLSLGKPERFANILEHRPGSVSNNVGHHRRPLPPVSLVTILDDLLTPFGLEIDIDIRRPPPLR